MSRPVGYLQNDISVYSPTGHFSLNKLEAIFFTGLQLYVFYFFFFLILGWGRWEVHSKIAHTFGNSKYSSIGLSMTKVLVDCTLASLWSHR